jgi:hypothetical protein
MQDVLANYTFNAAGPDERGRFMAAAIGCGFYSHLIGQTVMKAVLNVT